MRGWEIMRPLFWGSTMRVMTKRLLALFLLLAPIAAMYYATQLPLKAKIAEGVAGILAEKGLTDVEVELQSIGKQHIAFSRIYAAKEKMDISLTDVLIHATNLPYAELVRGDLSRVAAEWSVAEVLVSGIPYALPPLAGKGNFVMKDGNPEVTGAFADASGKYGARFTARANELILEDVMLEWQQAKVSSKKIIIPLAGDVPIRLPLAVQNLPLATLLSMLSGKASGTGNVSGNIEIILYPDGRFSIGGGRFGTQQNGLIQLSPEALPGDQPQIKIAREALSNFHYTELSLTTSTAKDGRPIIRLTLEGNNPEALNGRPVKLNVNLSGDVLEMLQQSLLPLADPRKYLEKDTP